MDEIHLSEEIDGTESNQAMVAASEIVRSPSSPLSTLTKSFWLFHTGISVNKEVPSRFRMSIGNFSISLLVHYFLLSV